MLDFHCSLESVISQACLVMREMVGRKINITVIRCDIPVLHYSLVLRSPASRDPSIVIDCDQLPQFCDHTGI